MHRTRPGSALVRFTAMAVLAVPPALLIVEVLAGHVADGVASVIAVATAVLLLFAVTRASAFIAVTQGHFARISSREDELERSMLEQDRVIARLTHKVGHDALTGLASRDGFVAALEAALDTRRAPSVALLDVDDFTSINDTLGHDMGDLLLRDIASRLRDAVQPDDVVARFDGDQFAVLIGGNADTRAEHLLEALRRPMMLRGRELALPVSIGITTATPGNSTAGDLLREADVAMNTAKRDGSGWARYRTGMSALLLERMDLHAQLVDALRDSEIVPWFQPVVELVTGRLIGFEALARWSRVDQPVRDPYSWLPLAEETGLIVSIDRAIFRAAVLQLAQWRSRYAVAQLEIAVNLSAQTLQHRGIAEEIIDVLAGHGVPADRLTVDVTEAALSDDGVGIRLQILRSAGVKVALDDFGTGWSSLGELQRFPVDQLKLDRTFTSALVKSSDGDAIPATVLQMAGALRLGVVAEGVETTEQRDRLIALGFRIGQGYFYGRPMPANVLESVVEQYDPPTTRPAVIPPGALVG